MTVTISNNTIKIDPVSTETAKAIAAKVAAEASETNAATSETNASSSASAAATSETNAANSASAAATSETNAATSASNAATSASNAAASESSVADDAADAEKHAQQTTQFTDSAGAVFTKGAKGYSADADASQTAAATSESNAATSASNAATSETNAASSASAASTSETNAAASESAAATSETNAANSASAASTSETNAAASETKAEEWAENPEDVEVETGKFSALHHSAKAQGIVDAHKTAGIADHGDVDLTDEADGDLLQRESGVYVSKKLSDVASNILVNTGWQFINIDFTRVDTVTSGSGSIDTSLQRRNRLLTGTTADSQAIFVTDRTQYSSLGTTPTRIDFSKKIVTQIVFSRNPTFDDNDGQCYFFLGSSDSSNWDQLEDGFGFRLDNLDIYALIKNGTESEQLIGELNTFDAYMLQAVSDGQGSVTFSVNTFSDVVMTGAPNSLSGGADNSWKFSTHNVNAGNQVDIFIAHAKIWIEQ